MKIDTTIQAGGMLEFHEPGDFFRLMDSRDPVDVRFYAAGKEVSEARQVGAGFAERFRTGSFDRVQITSATTQAISFVIRNGADVYYDKPPTGAVTLEGQQGAFTQLQATVKDTSVQLRPAKANRRYLLIQNNHSTADVYVTLDGTAATAVNGVRIPAGGSYELQGFVPNSEIHAIGSIASNAAVVVVEG